MKRMLVWTMAGMLAVGAGAQTGRELPFQKWALTPPMGWNSWDCYGPTVVEDEVKANTDYRIVTRLDEVQKRISLAIKIWKQIEEDIDLKDWNLNIVGFGESEHKYRKLVSHLGLKRISFEGKQNPIKYYKESSLFIMTSLFEGWPMTLNESLQFGCIPFVYDTCASFHEIIDDGKNGFLIADKDEKMFYHKMREVMLNENRRMELTKAAVESSTRFTLDKIVTQWEKLLNE